MVDFGRHSSFTATADDTARHLWQAPAEFLDQLPVALYLCGSDGRLLRYNQRAADLWGRRPAINDAYERYCGFHRGFLPDGTPLRPDENAVAEVLRTGRTIRDIEVIGERPDGSRVNALVAVDAVRDADGAVLGALVCLQDLTARKRLEQAVARRASEQAALYEFTDRLFRAATGEEVYAAALDAIIRALGCSRASVLLFDSRGKMEFVAWRGLSDTYRQAVAGHSPWRPGDRDARPICIADLGSADLPDDLREAVQRERIAALSFIPLAVNGAVIGKFMTYYATPHQFGDEETELAVTIARQLGFGIARLRAEEARANAERALGSEREILRTIIGQAPILMTFYNPTTGMFQVNREFERLIGWSSQQHTAEQMMELTYPDPKYRTEVAAFIESCRDGWQDLTMMTRSGRPIETSWANYRLTGGLRVGIGIEITDRKRTEVQQALLLGEMSHRLRNLFVVASSVVNMSARDAHTPDEMAEAVQDRLGALNRAHDLTRPAPVFAEPVAVERETSLQAILEAIFSPYAAADGAPRFTFAGADLPIGGDAVTGLALVVHELATNAAKYGALSRAGGHVAIDATLGRGELLLLWREQGGPALEGPRETRGFGSYLTERVVLGQLEGRLAKEWDPAGLIVRLWLPTIRLRPRGPARG